MFVFIIPSTKASIYFDVHASFGSGDAIKANESASPNIFQYGVGTTLGMDFMSIVIGLSADQYYAEQMSEVKAPYGNRKGVRTNLLSPTIVMNIFGLILKFDYQFMGSYSLDKETVLAEKVQYQDPTGFRFYIGSKFDFIPWGGKLGLFYESIEYATELVGSKKTTLTDKLSIKQIGIMIVF